MPDRKDEVLLRVEHLCQYFKENKAVDDVSFDIKKGEVFGLVGESGCGKTTTGRSIIKLYNITSGSIYFKGHRIAAGTRSYKQAIAQARVEMKSAAPERQKELKDDRKGRFWGRKQFGGKFAGVGIGKIGPKGDDGEEKRKSACKTLAFCGV